MVENVTLKNYAPVMSMVPVDPPNILGNQNVAADGHDQIRLGL
jgi:hypothetical protein